VGIVPWSDSDLEVMLEAVKVLDALEVGSEWWWPRRTANPERTHGTPRRHARGIGVLIAGGRRAAALPGVLAASSPLPVIGVPVAATPLGGLDALLSIVQMPKGVPVATVAIGKWARPMPDARRPDPRASAMPRWLHGWRPTVGGSRRGRRAGAPRGGSDEVGRGPKSGT